MKKSRILYFHQYPDFDTGSPKSLVSMIEGVDRNQFEPVFLAPEPGDLVNELVSRNVGIHFGKVNSVSPKQPLRGLYWIYEKIRFLREKAIKIVHLNEFGWNSDIVFAAWLLGIPVVLHIHNPGQIHRSNLNCVFCKLVLTCSEKNRSQIENLNYIESKCKVLYNQVDIDRIEKGVSIRSELSLADDDIVVGTIAQVCHRKGIDILLKVAGACIAEYPKLKLLVVGPDGKGEENYANEMREIASDARFNNSVIFLGARRDIPDLLASMDIFMLPTRSEPFGIVIIEAMAAGLPVIASQVGGIPEIIGDESIGFIVPSEDAAANTVSLRSVLELSDLGASIGARAKKHVEGRFDSATISRNLNRMYQGLLR